jgi:uncharacterized protein
MTGHSEIRFDPSEFAFDIDGVVADTMEVFVRLARERYGLTYLTKEHLACYNLYQCLEIEKDVIDDLICLTLDDEHTLQIPPVNEAPAVLTELSLHGPLRFVTARIWPESIIRWLHATLPDVDTRDIQVVATGAPEAKLKILKDLGVRCFVEDRIETCKMLAGEGIQPLVFDQPWNRAVSGDEFPRIRSWSQLRQWVLPRNGKLM